MYLSSPLPIFSQLLAFFSLKSWLVFLLESMTYQKCVSVFIYKLCFRTEDSRPKFKLNGSWYWLSNKTMQVKYSQASFRWSNGKQTNVPRTNSVLLIKELTEVLSYLPCRCLFHMIFFDEEAKSRRLGVNCNLHVSTTLKSCYYRFFFILWHALYGNMHSCPLPWFIYPILVCRKKKWVHKHWETPSN